MMLVHINLLAQLVKEMLGGKVMKLVKETVKESS